MHISALKTVLIKGEEFPVVEHVTAHMAAIAASPWGYNPRRTKVQTSYKVNYLGRNRRIYSDIISNNNPCYVLVKGKKHFVN